MGHGLLPSRDIALGSSQNRETPCYAEGYYRIDGKDATRPRALVNGPHLDLAVAPQ